MNSSQLNCFLAVADSLSFARAAEKLHITQPAVTHQINSLENELDVTLFKRTTRTVELTKEGYSFIADAKSILNTISLAKVRFSSQEKEAPIPFRIGCNHGELHFLHTIIKKTAESYPNIHPFVKTIPFPAQLQLLQSENIDVLFGMQGMANPKHNFRFRELAKASLSCIMPKDHPLAQKDCITSDDLASQPIAFLDTHNMPSPLLTAQGQLLKNHPTSNVYSCETTEEILLLARAGMAITFMPDIVPMREESLAYIPVKSPVSVSYGLYYKTLQKKPLLKHFIQNAGEFFQN